MSPIKGYTSEEQHISRLENDPQYHAAWVAKHAHQRSFNTDPMGDRLRTGNEKGESRGRSTYWEGQNGIPLGIKLFLWVVLTFAILVGLCMVFGVGYFPPLLTISAVLSTILLTSFLRRLERG